MPIKNNLSIAYLHSRTTMKELLLQALVIAYGTTSIISLSAYWPTIRDLYYKKKPSANIASYILWSSTGGIGFIYAIFIISDLLLSIVSGINFFACLVVLVLSIGLKQK